MIAYIPIIVDPTPRRLAPRAAGTVPIYGSLEALRADWPGAIYGILVIPEQPRRKEFDRDNSAR